VWGVAGDEEVGGGVGFKVALGGVGEVGGEATEDQRAKGEGDNRWDIGATARRESEGERERTAGGGHGWDYAEAGSEMEIGRDAAHGKVTSLEN
jgi:hypothetical protein